MHLLAVVLLFLSSCSCRYHRFQSDSRNTPCECVHPDFCTDEEKASNGHGLIDPRSSIRICADENEICCTLQQPPAPDSSEPLKTSSSHVCGLSFATKTRITSGSSAPFGELPWNLIVQENDRNLYKCGASLIHPKVALTAAHCVAPYAQKPEKLLIRAGEWDVDSRNETLPFQDNFVEEILIYYDYDALSLKNDIAILILSGDFQVTENVGIVCLSQRRVEEDRCVVSGWGKDAPDGRYSSTMKKVQVPLVSTSQCVETLRETRLGPRYSLHKSFICAGGEKGKDSCKGDGGSPLICPLVEESGRFVQIGIVSWGIGCGQNGVPGIYVNVPLYLDWIEGEMKERDLDSTYFKA